MKAVLVQPPFTQLNAPYPAVHYLEAFLRGRGHEARSFDHGIALYRGIFSRQGLARLFSEARRRLADEEPHAESERAARGEIDRYLSYEALYLEWIDPIVDFLSGADPSFAHRLAQAVELPRGSRAAAFLDSSGGRISSEESRTLATLILEDLGDFVAGTFDPEFGTVRYAERLASSRGDFAEIRSALASSYLLSAFYRPFLRDFWRSPEAAGAEMVLVTIPFPGCLLGALTCAQEARAALGASVPVLFGGGYVSTELRALCDPGIFDYCDYLCFDSGYGSLASILEARGFESAGGAPGGLYRSMFRLEGGRIGVSGFPSEDALRPAALPGARAALGCADAARFAELERAALASVQPDYASADFREYFGVVDSENPMHRLWSDAPWLKYRLAHGCYWRRCAFCDTELEYVADFVRGESGALMRAAEAASTRSGLAGIHFVDEAMPMADLLAFAAANRSRAAEGKRPFHFWGNVRFDSSWTEGRCEFLAASGLMAVSGGIEVATERGLEMTDKGFDLAGLVRCLVAMKRSGLLVHAYLIYGFPDQDEGEILDSAEFCRQLFAAGLVDSAFWHRFVLTRHSRMYGEWKAGARPALRPLDAPRAFADNDLAFEGEERFDRFEEPLAAALAAWMGGEALDRPAADWFGARRAAAGSGRAERTRTPRATTPSGLVESLIARAERELAEARPRADSTLRWLAGTPLLRPIRGETGAPPMAILTWAYRGAMEELILKDDEARRLRAAILELGGCPGGGPGGCPGGLRLEAFAAAAFTEPAGEAAASALGRLFGSGLAAT
ncbi:MAG TPA: radical SAM protein [Rectinemataceae bacterium]|nr:radical SAM protein [Rectinemataceae bacterium]